MALSRITTKKHTESTSKCYFEIAARLSHDTPLTRIIIFINISIYLFIRLNSYTAEGRLVFFNLIEINRPTNNEQ